VNDLVNIVTHFNSNVSINLITDLSSHINLTNVCHDLKDVKWTESIRKNNDNTNLNESVKKPRKKQKISNSLTQQNSKTNTSKEDSMPSFNYPIIVHILTEIFRSYSNPNWEPNIIIKMPEQKLIPRSIKKGMQAMFKFI
jgi:hypothetical protein